MELVIEGFTMRHLVLPAMSCQDQPFLLPFPQPCQLPVVPVSTWNYQQRNLIDALVAQQADNRLYPCQGLRHDVVHGYQRIELSVCSVQGTAVKPASPWQWPAIPAIPAAPADGLTGPLPGPAGPWPDAGGD